MKRIFISQPIKNKDYNEVMRVRNEAVYKLTEWFPDETIQVIDSFIPAMYYNANNNPIVGLGTCISLMGDADYVFMCEGWENARGCCIERRVAIDYGIPVLYYNKRPN